MNIKPETNQIGMNNIRECIECGESNPSNFYANKSKKFCKKCHCMKKRSKSISNKNVMKPMSGANEQELFTHNQELFMSGLIDELYRDLNNRIIELTVTKDEFKHVISNSAYMAKIRNEQIQFLNDRFTRIELGISGVMGMMNDLNQRVSKLESTRNRSQRYSYPK